MLLQFSNGSLFSAGVAPYFYQPASPFETIPRIIVSILLGNIATSAYIDTGAVNLICPPDIGAKLLLHPENSLGSLRMLLRGVWYFGHLYRVPLSFPAEEGYSVEIEVTAFVPQLEPHAVWPDDLPCILGMSGCLERLRFAIDPLTDSFYFGELNM